MNEFGEVQRNAWRDSQEEGNLELFWLVIKWVFINGRSFHSAKKSWRSFININSSQLVTQQLWKKTLWYFLWQSSISWNIWVNLIGINTFIRRLLADTFTFDHLKDFNLLLNRFHRQVLLIYSKNIHLNKIAWWLQKYTFLLEKWRLYQWRTKRTSFGLWSNS